MNFPNLTNLTNLLKPAKHQPKPSQPDVNLIDNRLIDLLAPAAVDLATADDSVGFSATEWLRIVRVQALKNLGAYFRIHGGAGAR